VNLADRTRLVRLERKAFRARKAPGMPALDSAGFSTKPWGANRIRGISPRASAGPSKRALDFWKRATGQGGPASTRRRRRGPFALSTPAL
jgi:hypothetical protein